MARQEEVKVELEKKSELSTPEMIERGLDHALWEEIWKDVPPKMKEKIEAEDAKTAEGLEAARKELEALAAVINQKNEEQ